MLDMSPEELAAAYELSARPYLESDGSCMWQQFIHMKSWRYVLEISSACNLHCTLCHAGNRSGYQYTPGIMDMDLFERILDKIQKENPQATVCAYVNSEPFLHPHLPECIASIKKRGLRCEIATNGNMIPRYEEVLAAQPDMLTVSVSGFTQDVYQRAHQGGDIETVKQNITKLVNAYKAGGYKFFIAVSYHKYKDNIGDEQMGAMRAFTENLGILFMVSCGRVITMENTVQALRWIEAQQGVKIEPYDIKPGMDLNTLLPEAKPEFIAGMERLLFHPLKARELYSRWPVAPVCLIADVFTEIRHDGRVQLCAWTDDMRLTLGNYLDMTHEQISAARREHPLCRECLRYRMNLYFHIVDRAKWES